MEINDSFVHEKLSDEQRLAVEKLPGISKIDIIDTITIGRSGASVFVVDVDSDSRDGTKGRCILKIDQSGSGDSERKRHEDAYKTAIKEYMAELVDYSLKDKSCEYVAVIYTLAHDTLLNACPLYEYVEKNFNDAVSQIRNLAKTLNTWNADFTPKREHPYKLITTLLGSLLKGAKSIQNIAQENLGIKDVHELRFSGSKSVLPNPIAYISQENLWKDAQICMLVCPWGYVHYDLHSANIICPTKGTNKTPVIIDFRKYEKDFITLYDYAYLEFDLILKIMPANTYNTREEWLKLGKLWSENLQLSEDLSRSPNSENLRKLIAPLRSEVAKIAENAGQKDDFFSVYLLTSVAVGLNWFRKLHDTNQKNLALLLAAQRLDILLERIGLKVLPGDIGEVHWLSQYKVALDSNIQKSYQKLRDKFSSALRERRVLLLLGSEVNRWIGFPSEQKLAETVASKFNSSIRPVNDEDDYTCFNTLVKNHSSELEQIRINVSECYKLSSPDPATESKLKALALGNWLAVIDWSFSPWLSQLLKQKFYNKQQISTVTDISGISKINLGNTLSLPWIFLRGTVEVSKELVLGSKEWRLRLEDNYPKKALEQLYKTGRQDSSTIVICLGCKGKVLRELYNLTQSIYRNTLQFWAIATDIEQDQEAHNLQNEEEDIELISLSPEQFCDFLACELPPSVSQTTLTNERYVMELTGIEVKNTGDESSSIVVRDTENEQIVKLSIPEDNFFTFKTYLEILYTGIEIDSFPPGHLPGASFYQGHKITWKDLALGYDVQRKNTTEILKTLEADLKEQIPRRIRLYGEPGAGISTMAARLAWHVYKVYHVPVAIVRRIDSNLVGLTDVVFQLRDFLNRSFLLIAEDEYIKADEADRLFERLQSERVPVIMLQVERREENKKNTDISRRKRQFFVKDELSKNEHIELHKKIIDFIPKEKQEIFFEKSQKEKSLFINLLIAFEEKFVRLEDMVVQLLQNTSIETKELLAAIAFCNRYAHKEVPLSFLANVTQLSTDQIVNFLETINERLILTHKSNPTEISYSCRHDLISLQVLRQIWRGGSEYE